MLHSVHTAYNGQLLQLLRALRSQSIVPFVLFFLGGVGLTPKTSIPFSFAFIPFTFLTSLPFISVAKRPSQIQLWVWTLEIVVSSPACSGRPQTHSDTSRAQKMSLVAANGIDFRVNDVKLEVNANVPTCIQYTLGHIHC